MEAIKHYLVMLCVGLDTQFRHFFTGVNNFLFCSAQLEFLVWGWGKIDGVDQENLISNL